MCAAQLASGLQLKMIKYFQVMLKMFKFFQVKEIAEC